MFRVKQSKAGIRVWRPNCSPQGTFWAPPREGSQLLFQPILCANVIAGDLWLLCSNSCWVDPAEKSWHRGFKIVWPCCQRLSEAIDVSCSATGSKKTPGWLIPGLSLDKFCFPDEKQLGCHFTLLLICAGIFQPELLPWLLSDDHSSS